MQSMLCSLNESGNFIFGCILLSSAAANSHLFIYSELSAYNEITTESDCIYFVLTRIPTSGLFQIPPPFPQGFGPIKSK